MDESSNSVPVGRAEISQYKSGIEERINNHSFAGSNESLSQLIIGADPNERYMPSALDSDVYTSVRDGLQIYEHISALLKDKMNFNNMVINMPDSEVKSARALINSFATYVAASYVTRRIDESLDTHADRDKVAEENNDLASLENFFKPDQAGEAFVNYLLGPIYDNLVQQSDCLDKDNGKIFTADWQVAKFVRDVFSEYVGFAESMKDRCPELSAEHLDGYVFEIMDDYMSFRGWENTSSAFIPGKIQEVIVEPIYAEDIIGNRELKKGLSRMAERLCLHDPRAGRNPILELGGLSWTTLLDGYPGTGKSLGFKYLITRSKEFAEAAGLPLNAFFLDPSIKDKMYGGTGKKVIAMFEPTNDPGLLTIGIFDDFDLMSTDRNQAQGADNDINNLTMQYLDGARTVRRGNVINLIATNQAGGLEKAVLNRMGSRLLVSGPETAEDFADMSLVHLKKLIDAGLIGIDLGYEPFATQVNPSEIGHWSDSTIPDELAERFASRKKASLIELGKFLAEAKVENPRITGRSAKAIFESAAARTADFDVPLGWFENQDGFIEADYDRRAQMLAELYQPITPDVLFQAAQVYIDAEKRYGDTDEALGVGRDYDNIVWRRRALLDSLLEEAEKGENSETVKIHQLQQFLATKANEVEAADIEMIRKAREAEKAKVA